MRKGNFHTILKEYINEVISTKSIFEAAPREGVGTALAKRKEIAREKYENALKLQDDWNAASEKYEKWKTLKPAQRKQNSGEEPVWPSMSDGSKTTYSSAKKVARELEIAREEYRKLDPRLTTSSGQSEKLKYIAKGGAKSEEDMQVPDEDTDFIMSIDDVDPTKWYVWPKQVLKSGIPYGSAAEGEGGGAEAGVGPAEAWLALLFGGKKQGGGVSYDVVTRSNNVKGPAALKTWEVKELKKPSDTIRPGTHGLKVFAKPYQNLRNVITQLKNFYILAEKLGFTDPRNKMLSDDDRDIIGYVKDFIIAEREMISEKGEISEERITSLYTVLDQVKGFVNRWSKKADVSSGEEPDTEVSLNDKPYKVDKPTFVDIARKVQKSTGEKPPVEDVEILLSSLRHPAFLNPTDFLDEFFNSVDPEEVFSQTSGVFIVNPRGFMMLPAGSLKDTLTFKKVTQGKPRFALNVPFGP